MVEAHPPSALRTLSDEECWMLVEQRSVGRFAANRRGVGPLVVPVNYRISEDRVVVFRTGAGGKLNALGQGIAVVQVDEIDPLHHVGWSVMIEGTTEWLHEEQDDTPVDTWAPGPRPFVVRMTPVRISGRRIHLHQADTDERGYR